MSSKNSNKRVPGNLIAFITLCIVWFLEYTGLLGLLL
jgi:hypothetical protein